MSRGKELIHAAFLKENSILLNWNILFNYTYFKSLLLLSKAFRGNQMPAAELLSVNFDTMII